MKKWKLFIPALGVLCLCFALSKVASLKPAVEPLPPVLQGRDTVKVFPFTLILLMQCDHPLVFYGTDTLGHINWLDATKFDQRQLMLIKQTVDQNHFLQREVPCIGMWKGQKSEAF